MRDDQKRDTPQQQQQQQQHTRYRWVSVAFRVVSRERVWLLVRREQRKTRSRLRERGDDDDERGEYGEWSIGETKRRRRQ